MQPQIYPTAPPAKPLPNGSLLVDLKKHKETYETRDWYLSVANQLGALFGLVLIMIQAGQQLHSSSQASGSSSTKPQWPTLASAASSALPWLLVFVIGNFNRNSSMNNMQQILKKYGENVTSNSKDILLNRYQMMIRLAVIDVFSNEDLAERVGSRLIVKMTKTHFDEEARAALAQLDASLMTILDLAKESTFISRSYVVFALSLLVMAVILAACFVTAVTRPNGWAAIAQLSATAVLAAMALVAIFANDSNFFPQARKEKAFKKEKDVFALAEQHAKMVLHGLLENLGSLEYERMNEILEKSITLPVTLARSELLITPTKISDLSLETTATRSNRPFSETKTVFFRKIILPVAEEEFLAAYQSEQRKVEKAFTEIKGKINHHASLLKTFDTRNEELINFIESAAFGLDADLSQLQKVLAALDQTINDKRKDVASGSTLKAELKAVHRKISDFQINYLSKLKLRQDRYNEVHQGMKHS